MWERLPEWEKWSVKEVSVPEMKVWGYNAKLAQWNTYFKEYKMVIMPKTGSPFFEFEQVRDVNGHYDTKARPDKDYKYTLVSYDWDIKGFRTQMVFDDYGNIHRSEYMIISTGHDSDNEYSQGIVYRAVANKQKEKDKLIETVSAPEGTYPDNGIKDGFWYIKKK